MDGCTLAGTMGTLGVGLFATPDAEAMQLRNLVMGHLISAAVVYAVVRIMGVTSFSRALAFALSMASMILTKSVHPPGGGLVVLYMDSGLLRSLGAWCVVPCGCESIRCGCPAYVRSTELTLPTSRWYWLSRLREMMNWAGS